MMAIPVINGTNKNGQRMTTLGIAILIIIVFGVFTLYMLRHLTATEPMWARATYLYGSVEAIAFAAVGWLFGKEVHREQAQSAEKHSSDAERELRTARVKAENGRTLAELVRIKAGGHSNRIAPLLALGGPAVSSFAQADLTELMELADRFAL